MKEQNLFTGWSVSRRIRVEIQVPELIKVQKLIMFHFYFFHFAPFPLHISIIVGIMDMGVIKPSKCPGHRYALCPINKHQFLTVFCKIRIYLLIRRGRRQSSTAASTCTVKNSTAWNGTRWSAPLFSYLWQSIAPPVKAFKCMFLSPTWPDP